MNIYSNKQEKDINVVIFGGKGMKYEDVLPVITKISEYANVITFTFKDELFVKKMDDIVSDIRKELLSLNHNDSKLVFFGISIGGLLSIMYHKLYPDGVIAMMFSDTTNPSSINYLMTQDYTEDVICKIKEYKNYKFDIPVVSHINVQSMKHIMASSKYKYYKNISSKSSIIMHKKKGHDLHKTCPDELILSIRHLCS